MNKQDIYASAGEYKCIRNVVDTFRTRELDDIMPKPLVIYKGYIDMILSTTQRCLDISRKLNKYSDTSLHVDPSDIRKCKEIVRTCTKELDKIEKKKKQNDIIIHKINTSLKRMKRTLDSPFWLNS